MKKCEVIFDIERCKGCELCVAACPKKIIAMDKGRINGSGYHPMAVEKPEACIGCANCAVMCPDGAVSIYAKREGAN